jgi:rhodanese-related sulfurtransferase
MPLLSRVAVDGGGFALLFTAAITIGLLVNQIQDHPLPPVYVSKAGRIEEAVKQIHNTPAIVAAAQEESSLPESDQPQLISLEDFRQDVEKKQGLILDARPEIFHRLGHVPGALSLPREDFENAYTNLRYRLESDRKQLLLVYCSDAGCEDSQMVADGLSKLGYRRVFVFKGGWGEWTAANLPQEPRQ